MFMVTNVRQKSTFGSSPGGSGIIVDMTWEFIEVGVVDSTVVEGLIDSIVVVVAFSTQM